MQPKEGLPTTAYYAKDEIREDGTQRSQKVFLNIPTEVGATEAEEVGKPSLYRTSLLMMPRLYRQILIEQADSRAQLDLQALLGRAPC